MTALGRMAIGPRIVYLAAVFTSVAPLMTDIYLPVMPEISADLGASAATTQLTIGAVLVGMALGQLVGGPISDQRGRRGVLIWGMVAVVVTSLASALAPTIGTLIAIRFVSGLAAAVPFVISRAMIADALPGVERARGFALLASVTGIVPVVVPLVGGVLALVLDWRGIFLALTAICALILVVAVIKVPETMPAEHRQEAGVGHALRDLGACLASSRFMAYVVVLGCAGGMLFAYIGASSFVLEDRFGLTPTAFGVVFAVNSVGIFATALIGRHAVRRFGPNALLYWGQGVSLIGSLIVLASLVAGWLPGILIGLFLAVSHVTLQFANGMALGIEASPVRAGAASALLGIAGFLVGGLLTPLSGLGGASMGIAMTAFVAIGLLAHRFMARPHALATA